jgi:hypothetical protein
MPAHDVNARAIARTGGVIVAAILACVGAVFGMLHLWNVPGGADRARGAHTADTGGPSLQAAPQPDLARYRAEKQRQLESSGWVDRGRGIAHIPIEAAMDLLASRSHAAASAARERQ